MTTHNLRAALLYAKQRREFGGASLPGKGLIITLVEEGFLVRREAATLHALLAADADAREAVGGVRYDPVGACSFEDLVDAHGGAAHVALALLLGELDRLKRYSRADANATWSATHGRVRRRGAMFGAGAAAGLDRGIAAGIRSLRERRHAMIAKGQRLLQHAPRAEMMAAAAPSPTGGSRHAPSSQCA